MGSQRRLVILIGRRQFGVREFIPAFPVWVSLHFERISRLSSSQLLLQANDASHEQLKVTKTKEIEEKATMNRRTPKQNGVVQLFVLVIRSSPVRRAARLVFPGTAF